MTLANLTDRQGNAACTQEETHTNAEPRALNAGADVTLAVPPVSSFLWLLAQAW